MYIVTEYCGKGDLLSFYKKNGMDILIFLGRFPESVCKKLANCVVYVLSQLHAKGYVHRDIKLANILITNNLEFKIADFGMAKKMDE